MGEVSNGPLVLTAAQTKAIDGAAIAQMGIPGVVLMENAGRGVAEIVAREWVQIDGVAVAVVCGPGQNGGDGFVVARHLANQDARVEVLLVAPAAKISGDARVFFSIVAKMPAVVVRDLSAHADVQAWRDGLGSAEVIVDAIFGTGLHAAVTGAPAAAIEAMNQTSALRVAIDLPSGLDADTGVVHGVAVKADITATMACRKLGLVLDPEAPTGRVEIIDIGVAPADLAPVVRAKGPLCHWLEAPQMAALLPVRRPGDHKGSGGHLLLVAGAPGKTGAALLASRAALRAGAGLVTVASTKEGQRALDAKLVEAMSACYCQGDDADQSSFARIAELAGRMNSAIVGPGIPTGPGTQAFVRKIVSELTLPLVIDADALNLLGTDIAGIVHAAAAPRILTPHPGEMGRLLGISTAAVQADRLGCARKLSATGGAVAVLKGARTVIAAPDGTAFINSTANPALATAGSGDVLCGLIGALLAQGLAAIDAACVGVFVHGMAADVAIATVGTQHLIAGDLPEAIAKVMDGRCGIVVD